MKRITRDQLIYHFDAATPPVLTIDPGETVVVESHDTATDRLNRAEDLESFIAARNPLEVNPAGGPIYVNGAKPGDALAVTILDIRLGPLGFVRTLNGAGALQRDIEPNSVLMVRTEGDQLIFGDKVRMPARPMVGVLGTAPADGRVYTAHPGPQGSNMDFNANTVGTTVYLPVRVPGGLLGIGDLHAAMGDGEVSGTGVEIRGETTARIDLIEGAAPKRPWMETATDWIATGQGETLEIAVEEAVDQLTGILQEKLDLTRTEAFLLVSARGDVRIGQAARIKGCDATVYALFPKNAERLSPGPSA
jgi:amidase